MYYVLWMDKEFDEIFFTTTTEKGIEYLKKHPELFEIYEIKEVKGLTIWD